MTEEYRRFLEQDKIQEIEKRKQRREFDVLTELPRKKLYHSLDLLNQILPDDPEHDEVRRLSLKIMDTADRIRALEKIDVDPIIIEVQNFLNDRSSKSHK